MCRIHDFWRDSWGRWCVFIYINICVLDWCYILKATVCFFRHVNTTAVMSTGRGFKICQAKRVYSISTEQKVYKLNILVYAFCLHIACCTVAYIFLKYISFGRRTLCMYLNAGTCGKNKWSWREKMCVSFVLSFYYLSKSNLEKGSEFFGTKRYPIDVRLNFSYALFASLSTFLKQELGRYLQPILKHMLDTLRSTEGFLVSVW